MIVVKTVPMILNNNVNIYKTYLDVYHMDSEGYDAIECVVHRMTMFVLLQTMQLYFLHETNINCVFFNTKKNYHNIKLNIRFTRLLCVYFTNFISFCIFFFKKTN